MFFLNVQCNIHICFLWDINSLKNIMIAIGKAKLYYYLIEENKDDANTTRNLTAAITDRVTRQHQKV